MSFTFGKCTWMWFCSVNHSGRYSLSQEHDTTEESTQLSTCSNCFSQTLKMVVLKERVSTDFARSNSKVPNIKWTMQESDWQLARNSVIHLSPAIPMLLCAQQSLAHFKDFEDNENPFYPWNSTWNLQVWELHIWCNTRKRCGIISSTLHALW